MVTARRREESLQSVPVAVTALSGDELKVQNINAPSDLQFVAPSTTVQAGLNRVGGSYTIRGVNAGVENYFSEAPGGPTTPGMPFFDLESVQVLNGPQGTLFGRAAAAGAILVTPAHPNLDEVGGYLDVSTGNYGRLQTTGVLNVPIIEGELAVRAVYNHNHIDGFTTAFEPQVIIPGLPPSTEIGAKYDEVNNDSFRVGIEWERGAFKNYAVGSYLNINQNGTAQVLSYSNTGLGALASRPLHRALIEAEQARIDNGGSVRRTPAVQGGETYSRYRLKQVVDVAEYDFGDLGFTTLTAKNVASYQEVRGVSGNGLDGVGGTLVHYNSCSQSGTNCYAASQQYKTPLGVVIEPGMGKPTETVTEEFQLQGTAAGFIDWTAGYFYSKNTEPKDPVGIPSLSRILSNPNGGGASFPFPNGTTVTEKAPFGHVSLNLDQFISGLTLSGGYRDTKSDTVVRTFPVVGLSDGVTYVAGEPNPETTSGFKGSNWTFGASLQINPDLMVYANRAKSFTPGGRNITIGCHVAPGCNDSFAPATLKSTELGFKSQFDVGDAAMRLNGALYRLDFADIQQTLRYTDSQFALIYVANVAEAQLDGAEIELDAKLHNVDFSLGYSYVDAKFTDWAAPDINNVRLPTDTCLPESAGSLCLLDLSNSPFQNTPKHQLRASIRYTLPVDASVGDMWIQLNGYYQSRQWHTSAPERELEVARFFELGDVTEAISQKAYAKFNARLGWDNMLGSKLSGQLFVDNLTDKTYSQAGSTRSYSLGTTVRVYAPPRMWGLNLRYDF